MNKPEITVGSILVNSIGCGYDVYYQVVHRTPKRLKTIRLKEKTVNLSVKHQTCDILPKPGEFADEGSRDREVTLAVHDDGRIGPRQRMEWWSVWEGKALNQWSP